MYRKMTRLARGGWWSGFTTPLDDEETAPRSNPWFNKLISDIKPRPERPRKARRFIASIDGLVCIEFSSRQNPINHFARHIGEPRVETLGFHREPSVFDAEHSQHRGVQ